MIDQAADAQSLDDVVKDYRTALLRFLPRRSEAALTLGYGLGRRAVSDGRSLLDLIQVHHVVLTEVLAEEPRPEPAEVMDAACIFLQEVLSTFEMAHRMLMNKASIPDAG